MPGSASESSRTESARLELSELGLVVAEADVLGLLGALFRLCEVAVDRPEMSFSLSAAWEALVVEPDAYC